MTQSNILFIGMDVHKDSIVISLRDADNLTRLLRSDDLTAVYVPNAEDEVMRDLSRARENAVLVFKSAKQRVKSFLLRHNIRFDGSANWSDINESENHKSSPPIWGHPEINSNGLTTQTGDGSCNFTAE